MARKKSKLEYIANNSKRRATFRARKTSLIKKIDEISTLCGVQSCAIIYPPNEPQPEVWPSPQKAKQVISKFKEIPKLEQNKRMLTQESLLRKRIQKAEDQLKKQKDENRQKEMSHLMFQCLSSGEVTSNASLIDLCDLSRLIDQTLKEIDLKIERIHDQEKMANQVEATQTQP
ncbi:hypothetical protein HN51_020143 [Arachis hypogaea]|uniref:MADS-box domain-containing protein n=2 Tax=Arachis TaxID=3817 RepID=A0A445BZV3_ARAHY|nr:agamous-like MADS-box protein AGL80 [Arachis duranensis]XP_025612014.1 agamous-like MADS-box protein AGL80 [Arachis hypogaea]QHO32025.1 Agamous-like MADS-box protein [Arachis hypogaea]RYR44152.1 hypothetical protein Ahy_A08g040534 [Arachis hypogaea]